MHQPRACSRSDHRSSASSRPHDILTMLEADHAAKSAHLTLRKRVTCEACQTRVVHLLDTGMALESLSDDASSDIVSTYAHHQGAETAREQERHFRGHHLPQVLAPDPDRFNQRLAPDDGSAREVAVSAEILRCAVNHEVGTQLEWTLVHWAGKSVIDNRKHPLGSRDSG
jgi:hypothetical protein